MRHATRSLENVTPEGGQRTLLVLALLVGLWAPAVSAQQDNDLFMPSAQAPTDLSPAQDAVLQALKSDPTAKDVELLEVNLVLPETADAINFNLPGEAMEMSLSRKETRGAEDYTWFGSDEETQGSAVLVVQDGEMVGNIQSGDRMYRVRPLGGGVHAVIEVDPSKFPDDHPDAYDELEADAPGGDLPGPEADLADDCHTTDLVVAYTPVAEVQAGNIDALIQLAIDETNESYANSAVSPRVRLVHSYETAYVESGNMVTDRNRFRIPGDGHMDEIHGLRTAHGGDIAILITGNGGFCGIAAAILADTSTAFAVVGQNCATGYYSFAHEIGHLQGARHNPQADPTNNPFPWGHGLFHAPAHWRTVMSYNCPGNCTRLKYWSNPNVALGGVPTGIAPTNYNVRVLDETACTMANFVQAPGQVTVTLIPAELSLKAGKTEELTALVRENGNPLPGVNVTFQSADTSIASVPGVAVTGASGQATVQVEGVADGDTVIEAEAGGATDKAAVKVPFGSLWALLAAAALALAVFRRRWAQA